jgi:1-acyl-sn-glycerol-3-phosphate acyltransferase
VLFVLLMLPVFIWSLIALAFGRIRGGNMIFYGCMLWADLWFFLIFIRHRNIYEGQIQSHLAGIYVSNHISYFDSSLVPKVFRYPVRPLGKIEMSKIPVFGFIYKNIIVTVDRSSTANRAKSVNVLKSLLQKGISILVFPEGTFNTTGKPLKDFYDGAFRIAIETGRPIRPVLLLDSFDRMRSLLTLNPGPSRAVFLEEIPVDGLTTDDTVSLKKRVHDLMAKRLEEYNYSWKIQEKEEKQEKV